MRQQVSEPFDKLPADHAAWFGEQPFERLERPSLMDSFVELPDGEQHPIDQLRDLIGDYRTIGFWRWVDENGHRPDRSWRRQVYIPKPEMAHRLKSLIDEIGEAVALETCRHFGGANLELPNLRKSMRMQAQRYATLLHKQGLNPKEIAQEVSESGYQVSPYQIRAWIRDSAGEI